MKIAIVCFNLKWQAGGTRLIYSLARGLMNNGHAVTIYAPDYNPDAFPELRSGLTIKTVTAPHTLVWNKKISGILRRIAHKLKQGRRHTKLGRRIAEEMDDDFDVVNLHDFAYKVAPFYKNKNTHAKIIWTENDPPYMYLPKNNLLLDILSRIFNRVKDFRERAYFIYIDKVAVLDFYNREWCLARGLHPVVIRSGVDFNSFYHPAHSRTGKEKSFAVFSLGALNPYRRFEDIIHAIKLLRDEGRAVSARIISKNIWHEDEYRAILEKNIVDLGMQNYITINFDGVTDDELAESFRTSDAFVLTTHLPRPRNGYGWGLSNFEAMASGLPLIICRTSTATEVLENKHNAIFIEPRNPKSLAVAVKYLMENTNVYNAIATEGQRFVKENISWSKYATDLIAMFKND